MQIKKSSGGVRAASRGDDTVLRSPAHPPHFSPETTSREAQVRGHGELEISNPEEERVTLGCP